MDTATTSIFREVSPLEFDVPTQEGMITYPHCKPIFTPNGDKYYTYIKGLSGITINEVLSLMNVYVDDELPRPKSSYDFFNYIIGFKDGEMRILFSRVNSSFEIGNKHLNIYTYAIKNNLLDSFTILLAGECLYYADGRLVVNFMSGSFTLGYKEKWRDYVTRTGKEIDIERHWFETDIKHIFERLSGASSIQYDSSGSFMDNYVQFHPGFYKRIERVLGGNKTLFFTKPDLCNAYGASIKYKQLLASAKEKDTVISTLSRRRYRKYVDLETGELKEEYNVDLMENTKDLDDMIELYGDGMIGGKKRQNRTRKTLKGKKGRKRRKGRKTKRV